MKTKLIDCTIDALLLGFEKPILFDYQIPSSQCIIESASFAIAKLFGNMHADLNDTKPANARMIEGRNLWRIGSIEAVKEKVKDGLERSLTRKYLDPDDDIPLVRCLNTSSCMYDNYKFGVEWFFGYGNLFRFRPGEKEKAEQKVKKYFTNKEMENFRQLHKPMNDYISEHFKRR